VHYGIVNRVLKTEIADDMASCRSVNIYRRFGRVDIFLSSLSSPYPLIGRLNPDHGGSKVLYNVGEYFQIYTESYEVRGGEFG
jgi:hypothetical protein